MPRPKLDRPNFKLAQRGSWFYVRWFENGRKQRVSLGTQDRREAQRKLRQFAAGYGTPEPPTQPTISAILEGYLKDREGRVASFDTLKTCCRALERHLGDLEPAHLTDEQCRAYVTDRGREGHLVGPRDARRRKPTSVGTAIRELVTLRAALDWAKRKNWIAERPYVEIPSAPAPRNRWLSRDEAGRLIAGALEPHIRTFLMLALHTAARTSAILQLRWQAIDLDLKLIDFGPGAATKQRGFVPINDDLLPVLLEANLLATTEYVVEYRGNPVESVKTGTRAAARRAGLPGVTPHILRHTAATWAAMAGIPMDQIARLLGHKNPAITAKVYAKYSPDYLREAVGALAGPMAPKTTSTESDQS